MNGVLLAEGACADISWTSGVGARTECAVSDAAQGLLEMLFNMLVLGSSWAVSWTGQAWLSFPEPTIGTADGTASDNIAQLWSLGSFYVMGIAVLGFLLGVIRLLMNPSMQSGTALARGVVAIIAVQSLSVGATVLLLDAGNQYSVWVVEQASGKEFETAFADFSGLGGVTSTLSGAGAMSQIGNIMLFAALGFVVLLLAAAAQVALLIIRSALLVVLMAFLPFLAAAAFTDGGYKALCKGIGWMAALILYKPVAGTIYAVGTLTLKNAADDAEATDQMMNLLIGVVIVAAAALALPALVKFVAPQAAAGASMAFSGGAVAAGAIGTGAAVVAMGATAGAAAPAAAGAAGAGAGAGAGAAETGAGAAGTGAEAAKTGERATTTTSTASDGGGSSEAPASSGGSGNSPTSSGTGSESSSSEGGETGTGDDGSASPANSSAGGTTSGSSDGGAPSGKGSKPGSTDSSGGEETFSSDKGQGTEGAEQASAPAPTASGTGATRSGRGGETARAVRNAANGTRSGAQQVDFNEGQEQS